MGNCHSNCNTLSAKIVADFWFQFTKGTAGQEEKGRGAGAGKYRKGCERGVDKSESAHFWVNHRPRKRERKCERDAVKWWGGGGGMFYVTSICVLCCANSGSQWGILICRQISENCWIFTGNSEGNMIKGYLAVLPQSRYPNWAASNEHRQLPPLPPLLPPSSGLRSDWPDNGACISNTELALASVFSTKALAFPEQVTSLSLLTPPPPPFRPLLFQFSLLLNKWCCCCGSFGLRFAFNRPKHLTWLSENYASPLDNTPYRATSLPAPRPLLCVSLSQWDAATEWFVALSMYLSHALGQHLSLFVCTTNCRIRNCVCESLVDN